MLSITRARVPETVTVPLLDREGKMVPEFEEVVRGWFQRFSEDFDPEQIAETSRGDHQASNGEVLVENAVQGGARVMTRRKGAAFASAITAVADIGVDDPRIAGLFAYSKALGNGQLLVVEELISYFVDRAKSKDALVEQNLRHQGIGPDLKPRVDY